MSAQDGSAKIVELSDARSRMRAGEIDIEAFATAAGYLKSVREASGYSLEEISARTHIKASYLRAIEDNDAAGMPSRPFALGFVKAFAETLELDADAVVAKFKRDAGFEIAAETEASRETPPPNPAPADVERTDMSLLAVLAVFVFILWCAWQITRPRDIEAPFRLDGAPIVAAAPAQTSAAPSEGAAPPELPVVVEATVLERIEPVYPRACEAAAAETESVTVAYTVTAEGGVAGERVVTASNPCFNRTSLNAIRRWRFTPRTIDGRAAPAYEQQSVFTFQRPL